MDIRSADFDGVLYHLRTTQESKSVLVLSISWKCWAELRAAGAEEILNEEYKGYVTEPEQNYNYSLRIDLATLPATPAERCTLHTAPGERSAGRPRELTPVSSCPSFSYHPAPAFASCPSPLPPPPLPPSFSCQPRPLSFLLSLPCLFLPRSGPGAKVFAAQAPRHRRAVLQGL